MSIISDLSEIGKVERPFDCDGHNPIIAAIDLGTNSCRLLVARTNIAGVRTTYFRTRPKSTLWKVVDSYSKVVRLGEGLQNSGELSQEAMDRTIEALSICSRKLERYHINKLRIVATEACRRAKNGQVLVDRAYQELGMKIDIIDSSEEAFLALKGCVAVLDTNTPYGIVFDIGGGSTEVIWVHLKKDARRKPGYPVPFEILDSISVPYGVVTTTETYQIKENLNDVAIKIASEINVSLIPFIEKNEILSLIKQGQVQIMGSSGTVTTLSALHLGLTSYNRRLVDGMILSYKDLRAVMNRILENNKPEESQSIIAGRMEYLLTGSMILKSLLQAFPLQEIKVADRGVREGILIDLLRFLIKF